MDVILDLAVGRGAHHRCCVTAGPLRRIAAGSHGGFRFGGGFDLRDHQAVGADFQDPLQEDGIVRGHANDRGHAGDLRPPDHIRGARDIALAVLQVDHHEVEAGMAEDLDDGAAAGIDPAAENGLALGQPLLQNILAVHFALFDEIALPES